MVTSIRRRATPPLSPSPTKPKPGLRRPLKLGIWPTLGLVFLGVILGLRVGVYGDTRMARELRTGRIGHAIYRTDYMEESCESSDCPTLGDTTCTPYSLLPVPQGAGHVVLSKKPEFFSQFLCMFKIEAPRDQRIQLTINNISIPETKDCVAGILRVFDGVPGTGGGQLLTSLCGNSVSNRLVQSKSDVLTLYYYQGPDIMWDKKSFNVTYTYVHSFKPTKGLTCNRTTEYVCANKLCIANGLKCDGYDNCGDGSEELLDVHVCGSRYNKSDPFVGVTVGIVVGVVLALNLLAAFTYWARRRAGPFFTDAQLRNNVENGDDDIPPVQDSDLSAPDLTRDLIDRQRPRSTHQEDGAANRNAGEGNSLSPESSNKLDGPPPSYSSLFPDLV